MKTTEMKSTNSYEIKLKQDQTAFQKTSLAQMHL